MTWSRATAIAGSTVVTLACCRIRIVRGHRDPVRSKNSSDAPPRSRCLLMVITQESTQSLAALNRYPAAGVRTPREQQDVALPLVIALRMEVFDIFAQRPPQGAFAKENHLGQALLLHRPDPALHIGIQVRAARRQHKRLDLA